MESSEIEKEIYEICKKHIGDSFKLYLFGSRASGKNQKFSDFDFFIKTNKQVEAEVFESISSDIDNLPTLYKIDLVYWNSANDDFKKMIELSPKREILF